MDIGVNMSISSQSIDVALIAQKAESLGFESMWLPEHPVMPVNSASRYPGSPDGSIPSYMADMGDPYIGLARASAVTQRIKLGTGISPHPGAQPPGAGQGGWRRWTSSPGDGSSLASARAGCGKRPK